MSPLESPRVLPSRGEIVESGGNGLPAPRRFSCRRGLGQHPRGLPRMTIALVQTVETACLGECLQDKVQAIEIVFSRIWRLVIVFLGYIRISQSEDVPLGPSSAGFMNYLSVWNMAGICAGISTSPTVRKIRSVKASRLRNPLARFLMILMTRLRPSEMALVRREPTKASTPA